MEITIDILSSLKRAKSLILAPKVFFASLKKEKGWKSAFSYVLAISGIGHILGAVLTLSFSSNLNLKPQDIVISLVISYIITLGLSFFWGGVLRVFLRLFSIESTFAQSYRLMVYTRSSFYLLRWTSYLSIIGHLYSYYLMILNLEKEYEISRNKAIIITAVLVLLRIVLFVMSFLFVIPLANIM